MGGPLSPQESVYGGDRRVRVRGGDVVTEAEVRDGDLKMLLALKMEKEPQPKNAASGSWDKAREQILSQNV